MWPHNKVNRHDRRDSSDGRAPTRDPQRGTGDGRPQHPHHRTPGLVRLQRVPWRAHGGMRMHVHERDNT